MKSAGRKYSIEETRKRIRSWADKRERTHWEARQKLIDWNIPHMEREELIAELIRMEFINELRYACAFAADKFRFYSWGSLKIEKALKLKGVSERNIRDALHQIDNPDVEQKVMMLIKKKLPAFSGLQVYQQKHKLAKFILGKGFRTEEAWRLIEKYFNC